MWTIIHIMDIALWIIMAIPIMYVCFFALASLFYRRNKLRPLQRDRKASFLILYPAYREDRVIVPSVQQILEQTYPAELFHVAVISDHMLSETNDKLRALPITLHLPQFEKSSKAQALQYAISHTEGQYDYVVILDADNVVYPEFLAQLNDICQRGYEAIQCHRCAKNSDNDIAVLDGVSEEINNTLFRRAHNAIGLSSALIGSGMCFTYKWFKANVGQLNTAVEDRELEALLLQQHIYIHFEDSIPVLDEKVSNQDNFQRQRLRWMNGQVQTLLAMLSHLPTALRTGNINYIDKTLQQALIPRSILLVLTPIMAFIMLVVAPVWSLKWWILTLVLAISLFIAIPSQLRTRAIFGRLSKLPNLVFRLLRNVRHIDTRNKDFLHTTHGS